MSKHIIASLSPPQAKSWHGEVSCSWSAHLIQPCCDFYVQKTFKFFLRIKWRAFEMDVTKIQKYLNTLLSEDKNMTCIVFSFFINPTINWTMNVWYHTCPLHECLPHGGITFLTSWEIRSFIQYFARNSVKQTRHI